MLHMQANQMFPVPLSWMVDETGQDLDDFVGFNFEHCGQASAQQTYSCRGCRHAAALQQNLCGLTATLMAGPELLALTLSHSLICLGMQGPFASAADLLAAYTSGQIKHCSAPYWSECHKH